VYVDFLNSLQQTMSPEDLTSLIHGNAERLLKLQPAT
jgi:hypothetical protein